MKLPNAQAATVPERKVTLYLLNPAHPAGGSKASFFLRFGFTAADWQRRCSAIRSKTKWWRRNQPRTASVMWWTAL